MGTPTQAFPGTSDTLEFMGLVEEGRGGKGRQSKRKENIFLPRKTSKGLKRKSFFRWNFEYMKIPQTHFQQGPIHIRIPP